ncbi:MAG: DUF4377 domain-containing protein [Myxococcota bacterium]
MHTRLSALLVGATALACSANPTTPAAPGGPGSGSQAGTETVEPIPAAAETNAPPVEPEPSGRTMYVHEQQVDCQGEGPMRCMQVREDSDGEWTWFYDSIEGFEYEEGYRYELRVEVSDVDEPPAGGSSKRYRLIEIVSKEKVGSGEP